MQGDICLKHCEKADCINGLCQIARGPATCTESECYKAPYCCEDGICSPGNNCDTRLPLEMCLTVCNDPFSSASSVGFSSRGAPCTDSSQCERISCKSCEISGRRCTKSCTVESCVAGFCQADENRVGCSNLECGRGFSSSSSQGYSDGIFSSQSSLLQQLPSCGDGVLDFGEQCDENTNSCIGSRACDLDSCTCYPTYPPLSSCRNGRLDSNEQCELGYLDCGEGRICDTSICTCILGELSDDNGDGDGDDGFFNNNPVVRPLTNNLVAAAVLCGNGILDDNEECDDRNRADNDGCSSDCLLEIGICGDGIVQKLLNEQCEASSHNPALSYFCNRCRFYSLTCGDGNVDAGEQCDDGILNSASPGAACRPDCSLARCGDWVIDPSETCDDGNRVNLDGCDRYCRTEGSMIASDRTGINSQFSAFGNLPQVQFPNMQQLGFPQYPNFKQLPNQLPLAQLQPLIQSQAPIGDTGPAAVAIVGAGAAAGWSWMRRKRR